MPRLSRIALLLFALAGFAWIGPTPAAHAQPDDPAVEPLAFEIEGTWTGAYTRGNAVQTAIATVEVVDDTARIAIQNDEWGPFSVRESAITPTGDQRLTFDTHYGTATVEVDSTYREMIGTAGEDEPSFSLHLKQSPPRPTHGEPTTEDVTLQSGDAAIGATIVIPSGNGPHPGLVNISGRGCGTRQGGVARLRWLARYGIGGIAYDDRGRGASDGSCKTSTIQTESLDARTALQALADHDAFDADRLGLRSNSAGGWVAAHATPRSEVPVSFLVTDVGPATSVEGQQKDNAQAIEADLDLAPADSTAFLRYVDLMFADDRPNGVVFAEMMELLENGEATGWADEFLVRDAEIGDVPATAAGLDSLWVRRYDYDPAPDLQRIDAPVLAFFGENDRVVPPIDNVPLFRQLMADAGKENARAVVLPATGHGFGQGSQVRTLDTPRGRYDAHYWKFYRPSPDYQRLLIRFLTESTELRMGDGGR
jgi:uncharacterized protein